MRCRLAGWWFLVLVLLPGAHPESAVDAAGAQTTNETKVDFDRIQRELLDVINAQRARAGAPPVALDDLAGQVAEAHAQEPDSSLPYSTR